MCFNLYPSCVFNVICLKFLNFFIPMFVFFPTGKGSLFRVIKIYNNNINAV